MQFVTCPECGKKYDAGLKECPECACPNSKWVPANNSANQLACPECGCPLSPTDKVCPECGCPVGKNEVQCPECDTLYDISLKACPECGCPNQVAAYETVGQPTQTRETQTEEQLQSNQTKTLQDVYAEAKTSPDAIVAHSVAEKSPTPTSDPAKSLLRTLKRVIMGYNDFAGRSRRSEFWTFVVFNCMVGFVLYLTLFDCVGRDYVTISKSNPLAEYCGRLLSSCVVNHLIITLVVVAYVLLMVLPMVAVTVRRLHDTNRSGYWVLVAIIPYILGIVFDFCPYIGLLFLSIMLLLDSVPSNRWGKTKMC